MSCGLLDHAAIDAGIRATVCFRCGVPASLFCRTDPGGAVKHDPYTGKPAYHQRRLDLFWDNVKAADSWAKYRQPATRP